jgi:RNA polymerase sigma-70 factor (ECF subfamily)
MQQSESLDQLVRQAQRGDPQAFASLIDRYERAALATAYGVLGDASSSADVVQDAFLRAWQRLHELRRPSQFAGWLLRMVRNLAIDSLRRQWDSRVVEASQHVRDPRPNPLEVVEYDETRRRVDRALAQLDELSRSAVVLRYYESMSSREIGEVLSLSPSAVDMRLSRARARLHELLREGSDVPVGGEGMKGGRGQVI